jgi:ATP-dependent Clp protease ATP-binding subunit ClpC
MAPRERLDEASAQVLAAASYEAHALGHDAVDTEHVLLALLADSGVAARLQALGVDVRDVREAVERSVERGESSDPGPRPFGAGAKRVLERALRESLAQGEGVIGPEDVMLALVADEEGVAGRVLRGLGVDLEHARGMRIMDVAKGVASPPPEHYCAIALTGPAEAWTEQLNERASDGWLLVEIVAEGAEQRAVFRRRQ